MIYNLFCVFVMYLFPLGVIIYSYSRILFKLCNRPTDSGAEVSTTTAQDEESAIRCKNDSGVAGGCWGGGTGGGGGSGASSAPPTPTPRLYLRRNDVSNIERARTRTLRMTVNIVLVFICCWTPYVVMTLWYTFHRESAKLVDSRVQDMLFITAVSNSCMNPLVYGNYVLNMRQQCSRLGAKICSNGRKQCSCCCCICVCGKPEAIPETIVMDVVPATTRPPRRKLQSSKQLSSQQPDENHKSLSSTSRNMLSKHPDDVIFQNEIQASSHRTSSPERGGYYRRGRRCHCSLTPEHSSAPAEMPSERDRRRSALLEDGPSSIG